MDGGEDLGVGDPTQVAEGAGEVGMPERRWIASNEIPSRDISTAWACRS
jgi:hypothetical protein